MQIVTRLELVGKFIERVVKRVAADVRKIARGGDIGNAADRQSYSVRARNGRAGNDGEIAVAAGELAERVTMTRRPAGDVDRLDQLVLVARGRQQSGEKLLRWNPPSLSLRRQFDAALEREQRQRDLCARIGVRDRAANRAAAAGLRVADPGQGGGE